MFKIMVIGVPCSGLTGEQEKLLADCGVICGAERLLALVNRFKRPPIAISPLGKSLPAIRRALASTDVAVLVGGDPLFFGIARRLLAEFGPDQLEIYPALSSMQEAFARFRLPWDDAGLLSLHGRNHPHVPGLLLSRAKNFVFTDSRYSPAELAGELIAYLELIEDQRLLADCRVMVAENIGRENENVFSGTLAEAAGQIFSDLNVFCLLTPGSDSRERLGLTERELAHSRGLITKDEVRAVTLHRLRLPNVGVMWDVGAGSGSVSLEAARLNPGLTIYAVEQKPEELINIKTNIRKHHCYNIVPVAGRAKNLLADLPDPQRVFIGGHSGELAEIIGMAAERLAVDGRLVLNGVVRKTIQAAPQLMAQYGLKVEMSTVEVKRNQPDMAEIFFNPITIITGRK